MNWLSNLKVPYKIVCLIVIAVIALASVGLTGIAYLRDVHSAMDEVANRQTHAVELLGDSAVKVRSLQARVLENLSLTDQNQLVKNKKNIIEYMDQYEANWQEYKALGFNNEAEPVIEQNWADFKKDTLEMLDLSIAGKQNEARDVYNTKGIKAIIGWDNAMTPMRKDIADQTKQINEANSGAVGKAVTSMLIQTFITLVILCFFGWMLINSIVRPLRDIMAGFTRLGNGDFRDDGVVVDRRDEFGEMENMFGDMRRNLAKLLSHHHPHFTANLGVVVVFQVVDHLARIRVRAIVEPG